MLSYQTFWPSFERKHLVRRDGYTLIEILVVIAVIGVIMGIVLPVFTSIKKKAQQNTCMSNLRQLGLAMQAYSADWDGRLPAARIFEGGEGNPYGNWAGCYIYGGKCDPSKGQLYPYVKNISVYKCPTANDADLRLVKGDAKPYPLSYSMNGMLSYQSVSGILAPTRVGLLLHENASTMDDGDFNWMGFAGNEEEGYNEPSRMHSGGTDILFCDFHVKWQSWDMTMDELTHNDWSPAKP